MAGNPPTQCRWWILIATILSGWTFLSSQAERFSYAPLPLKNIARQSTDTGADIVIFLRERCDDRTVNVTQIRNILDRNILDLSLDVMPRSLTCETRSWGLGALIHVLGRTTTKALIAALDSSTCEIAAKLAHLWNKPLLTWSCPLRDMKDRELSSIVRLSPSLPSLAQALAEIFSYLRWRSVAIISADDEPWSSLEKVMVGAFRSVGVLPRFHSTLSHRATIAQIRRTVRSLHGVSHRATILCLPLFGGDRGRDTIDRVLVELDTLRQEEDTGRFDSAILIVQTEDSDIFLPRRAAEFKFSSMSESEIQMNKSYIERKKFQDVPRYFSPPRNLSKATLEKLLAVVPHDRKYNVQKIYNGTENYVAPTLLDRLNESLNILIRDNSSINSYSNKMYTYVMMDWRAEIWCPILTVVEQEERLSIEKLALQATTFLDVDNTDFSNCDMDKDCSGDVPNSSFHTEHIIVIAMGSLSFALAAIITGVLIRKHLLKRKMSKGPYKIILTASDFVFPQVPRADSRTVDEGIEAMLCCWLQQLQEFGGPEVEKPDLLQLGSVSSLKPYLQASTGNLARHTTTTFFKDPRARYNGDLVQLKELPCQGSFELKNKAMDVLMTIHGLRHENLNPFIGYLNEPTRPCLVSEYCSRGSLEDVLVQDEIKLDWSFRLSLLTDLVRGMRYLHGTPIRVHGYLTSRNCVIDARWVLKVTDYGLPAFYEAQNIVPPLKTARDLLWTAPELLRHANLRKKGTQPGDVYSFGIIMQEVVVRGEPFCMLALSPEDIIEKVMKPPPLIRPSVSKGAAPPEAINIMRQCWAEAADMRPDFDDVHDLFKKLNHGRKVNFVDTMFQMLEKYSNNLEELIRERTEQLDMEKKKTEQLLNRMLPSSVAEKLKLGMPVDPEEFREVTIYFSDIVGFTTISAYSTPFQVVDLLNDLYTCFDATINAYTVYKVETIGDAYMVVGGCPVRIPDHASQVATMALDLLHQSGKFKVKHLPKTQLRLRIGLHTGPCCAGVVGLTMPRYCLFGDTVNTASRMESTGAPWRIHLSQATRDRLTEVGGYFIEYRGPTDVKGKGKMPTYWLLGKQGFDKELPTPPPLGENHGLDENAIIGNFTNINLSEPTPKTIHRTIERTKSIDYEQTEEAEEGEEIREEPKESEEHRNLLKSEEKTKEPEEEAKKETNEEPPETQNVRNERSMSISETDTINILKTSTKITGTRRIVTASIHGEKVLSRRARYTTDLAELLETSATDSRDIPDVATTKDRENTNAPPMNKSASGDTQSSLGTPPVCPAFCMENTMVHLGSSTSSLASISSSVTVPFRATASRHRRIAGYIDENDLSSPYNHYRCLSPNEHTGKSSGCRLLKRQFSLDRADDAPAPICASIPEQSSQKQTTVPRLFKQNSAGAANDLERIEEVPSTPGGISQSYRHGASVSLSVESLSSYPSNLCR